MPKLNRNIRICQCAIISSWTPRWRWPRSLRVPRPAGVLGLHLRLMKASPACWTQRCGKTTVMRCIRDCSLCREADPPARPFVIRRRKARRGAAVGSCSGLRALPAPHHRGQRRLRLRARRERGKRACASCSTRGMAAGAKYRTSFPAADATRALARALAPRHSCCAWTTFSHPCGACARAVVRVRAI